MTQPPITIYERYKRSADVLDYVINWSAGADDGGPWLETGDTIQSSSWSVPVGITKNSDSSTTTTTTVWLSGGTAGQSYDCTNTIVTAGGRTKTVILRIVVQA